MTVDDRSTTRRGPLVVAHRGASAEEPEHTLVAYRTAMDQGADGVECDVRLTADHHLVCVHDRRVERTSNGAGVVGALELARLEELDWASWRAGGGTEDHREAPDADPERGKLLTLRRLLDTLVGKGQEVVTLIETKHPTRHGDDVEKTLVQVLRGFDLDTGDRPGHPHVRVMSFSSRALQRVHRLSPELPLVHLVSGKGPKLPIDGTLPAGIGAVGLDIKIVRKRPKVVKRFRRHGHGVYVWTVDREEDVDLCRELGVDVIITNRPRATIDRLAATG